METEGARIQTYQLPNSELRLTMTDEGEVRACLEDACLVLGEGEEVYDTARGFFDRLNNPGTGDVAAGSSEEIIGAEIIDGPEDITLSADAED